MEIGWLMIDDPFFKRTCSCTNCMCCWQYAWPNNTFGIKTKYYFFFSDLNIEAEQNLQVSFENIRFAICDEIWMYGQKILVMMDKRLRQLKPDKQDEPFGGVFYIFMATWLIPVRDHALHMPEKFISTMVCSQTGDVRKDWKSFFCCCCWIRQNGLEQEEFRKVLSNIANGCVCESDYKFLQTRF